MRQMRITNETPTISKMIQIGNPLSSATGAGVVGGSVVVVCLRDEDIASGRPVLPPDN